jgi:hypothetical protein
MWESCLHTLPSIFRQPDKISEPYIGIDAINNYSVLPKVTEHFVLHQFQTSADELLGGLVL